MSGGGNELGSKGPSEQLSAIVRGASDTRLRATWRVLFAVLILWMLSQRVLIRIVLDVIEPVPPADVPAARLAVALIRVVFFIVAMVFWTRYIDRLSLSNCGVSFSRDWFQRLVGGFTAVLLVLLAWNAIAAAVGWITIDPVGSDPHVGFAFLFVTLALSAAIQQIVFFRVVLKNAAEGLHGRGVTPSRAVAGGLLVGLLFYVVTHDLPTAIRVLDLVVVGLVYGLLHVHTGDLGSSVGVHLGTWFLGSVLFGPPSGPGSGTVVFAKTGSLPAVLGVIDGHGFPKVLLAYLLLLAWIRWTQGRVPLHREIARRADR